MQVRYTDEISLNQGIKGMVYGASGVGKTYLLASAPKPIIISAEKGLRSLRKFHLPAIETTTYDQFSAAMQYVTSRACDAWTICLDSGSEIAETVLDNESKKSKDPRKAYGEMSILLARAFRALRDIPNRHVIMLAKEEYQKDGPSGAMLWRPSFPGQVIPQAAPYFFDEVFQLKPFDPLTPGQPKRRFLRTQPDLQNVAKSRSGNLLEWENADPQTGGGLTYLFEKMMKG